MKTLDPTNQPWQHLSKVVNPAILYAWDAITPAQQAHLCQAITPGTSIDCVVYPQTTEELATVVTVAHRNRWGILPQGAGTKIHWGGLVQDVNIVVSTQRLNRIIDHAVGDLTITVEAGTPFADIQTTLARAKQWLPVDPAYSEQATIGGIIATSNTGSLRHRYRGVRDLILGLTFVRSDGEIAKAGGRVVKNVAGYDLMKLFTGSYGTLGVITQVTLRVYPQPEASQTVILSGGAGELQTATQTLLSSTLTPVAVDLISPQLAQTLGLKDTLTLVVRFQSISPSVTEQSNRLLTIAKQLGLDYQTSAGTDFSSTEDTKFWQKLPQAIWESNTDTPILCKIGVLSTEAIATLEQLPPSLAIIHVSSGVGILRGNLTPEQLLQQRQWCQSQQGYLSILAAPLTYKQKLDIWGFSKTTQMLMGKLKHQFDPTGILSPHRF